MRPNVGDNWRRYLLADACIWMELPAVRGQEESLGGKMPEEITRNGPWVLQTDIVFSQDMKLTEKHTPMLINT